jgi:hypothetical protein
MTRGASGRRQKIAPAEMPGLRADGEPVFAGTCAAGEGSRQRTGLNNTYLSREHLREKCAGQRAAADVLMLESVEYRLI